jgi:hypothetical protein
LCIAPRASALVIFLFAVMLFGGGASAQMLDQDPGHSRFLMLEDVEFSCPKGFACARSRADGGAIFIPDRKYDLELVVGIASKDAGADWIEQLARFAASHVFPKERAEFSWKQLSADELRLTENRVSKFETGSGGLQGFNGQQRVMFKYRQIQVKEKVVIVGYLLGLGRGAEAKTLFEQNLGGDSMPGWYAEAHIIASLTGEKYTDINPGTVIIGEEVPAPRKN